MAAYVPRLRRRRLLAARAEVTCGSAETLTAVDLLPHVYDVQFSPQVEKDQRPRLGAFDYSAAVPKGLKGQLTFTMELTAGSAAPRWAFTLLSACGLGLNGGLGSGAGSGSGSGSGSGASGDIFLLDDRPAEDVLSTQHTITLGQWIGGEYKCLFGAMGNVKFTFIAGERVVMEFTFTGIFAAPVAGTTPVPTADTEAVLRFVSSSLTIGSWTPRVQQLTLDLGNVVTLRQDSSTATGYYAAAISNRRPAGTMNPETPPLGVSDPIGAMLASTEASLSFACSSGSASASFAATRLEFMTAEEAEREGIAADEIGFNLNNDDLQVTFV